MKNKVEVIENSEDLKRVLVKGSKVQFVHSETMTFAEWEFDAGTDLPLHSHPHEQITKVIEGEFELYTDESVCKLNAGKVAIIASNLPHSGKAITKCRVIDIFHPVREDYK